MHRHQAGQPWAHDLWTYHGMHGVLQMTKAEGCLDLAQGAWQVHNRVRALVGWPGTRVKLLAEDGAGALRPHHAPRPAACRARAWPWL